MAVNCENGRIESVQIPNPQPEVKAVMINFLENEPRIAKVRVFSSKGISDLTAVASDELKESYPPPVKDFHAEVKPAYLTEVQAPPPPPKPAVAPLLCDSMFTNATQSGYTEPNEPPYTGQSSKIVIPEKEEASSSAVLSDVTFASSADLEQPPVVQPAPPPEKPAVAPLLCDTMFTNVSQSGKAEPNEPVYVEQFSKCIRAEKEEPVKVEEAPAQQALPIAVANSEEDPRVKAVTINFSDTNPHYARVRVYSHAGVSELTAIHGQFSEECPHEYEVTRLPDPESVVHTVPIERKLVPPVRGTPSLYCSVTTTSTEDEDDDTTITELWSECSSGTPIPGLVVCEPKITLMCRAGTPIPGLVACEQESTLTSRSGTPIPGLVACKPKTTLMSNHPSARDSRMRNKSFSLINAKVNVDGKPTVVKLKVMELSSSQCIALKQCLLCAKRYLVGDNVIRLPCSHVYHRLCMLKYIAKKAPKCPGCGVSICQQDVTSNKGVEAEKISLEKPIETSG